MDDAADIVRRSLEAWNAQDVDRFVACLTEDVTFHVPESVPFGGSLTGREAVAGFAHELWAVFEELEAVVHRVVGAGDRVIVDGVHQGRTSARAVDPVPFQNAVTLRDGGICDLRQQMDSGLVMRAFAAVLATAPRALPAR